MDVLAVTGGQYKSGWPKPRLLNVVQGISQTVTEILLYNHTHYLFLRMRFVTEPTLKVE
jgi:hypothetical protein